jgi:glycosyltransferase involved in cell wall biosynthesis
MKIAWFSPFKPQKSGISDYSEQIVYELRKHCEVHLWADSPVDEHLRRDFKVIDYIDSKASLSSLKEYDAIIYNMGNNAVYHSNIYKALIQHHGLVILHDYYLNGFFMNYLGKIKYLFKLFSIYGMKGLLWYADVVLRYRFTHHILRRPSALGDKTEFSFDKEICSYAKALVVHSDFIREKLLNGNCSRPIAKINHPYFRDALGGAGHAEPEELTHDKGKFVILSIGEATPYKQLDKVILALAGDRHLREDSVYYIIGQQFDERIDLGELIERHGLKENVKMLGYMPVETVYKYLSRADAYIGIRYPTMGETSGGLIRAMEQGRACIVTDVGWYAELPEDCVAKIGAPVEVEELRAVLRRLMDDVGYRESLGRNAREHIHEEYSTELYVDKLLNFTRQMQK